MALLAKENTAPVSTQRNVLDGGLVTSAMTEIELKVNVEKELVQRKRTWNSFGNVGDIFTVLNGRRFWNFPRLAGDCSNGRAGRLSECSSDMFDSCALMVLQLHNQIEIYAWNPKQKIVMMMMMICFPRFVQQMKIAQVGVVVVKAFMHFLNVLRIYIIVHVI